MGTINELAERRGRKFNVRSNGEPDSQRQANQPSRHDAPANTKECGIVRGNDKELRMENREILDAHPGGDLIGKNAVGNRGRYREHDDLEGFHGARCACCATPEWEKH